MFVWVVELGKRFGVEKQLVADGCEAMAKNIHAAHPRLHKVMFEDLAKSPRRVFGALLKDVGVAVDAAESEALVSEHPDEIESETTAQLADRDLNLFAANADCRTVLHQYRFPLAPRFVNDGEALEGPREG